jgi:hypothetical protein
MPIIDIPTEDYNTIAQAMDDIIRLTGSPCKIFYPPKLVPCDNCNYSPLTKRSAGIYRHGGPLPFPANSICPSCSGNGTRAEEVSETITLVVYFDGGSFKRGQPDIVKIPGGVIQIKGMFTDAYKIQRADYILPANQNTKYRLSGDIIPINEIVKNRYFIARLERVV